MIDETQFTIKQWEENGIKYHAELPGRYKNQKIVLPIFHIGDATFLSSNMILMENLKYDYPIKFQYEELHNEKVQIPIAKPQTGTPTFVFEDELNPEPQFQEGITTIVKTINPQFTVQIKLTPNNWGTPRKILVLDHYENVEVPKVLNEEDWKQVLLEQFDYFYPKVRPDEKHLMLTYTIKQLSDLLISALEKQELWKWSDAFVQILFHLPSPEYVRKPVYVEDKRKSLPLKNVDIDAEVIGEDYTFKTKITTGSIMPQCNVPAGMEKMMNYYLLEIPILPFICDWFNVPIPEEKKIRFGKKRGDE